MGLNKTLELPCNKATGICECLANMDNIIINSPNYNSGNISKCGYFNGINSFGHNTTLFITFPETESSDIKGCNCGKHVSQLRKSSSDYSMVNLYRCGLNAGKTMGKNFKNGTTSKNIKNNLLVFAIKYFLA